MIRISRDNDELKHSMRSVLLNFRLYTERFHLITSDFQLPATSNLSLPQDWRLGQVPQWLDETQKTWMDEKVALSVIHHAEFFETYSGTTFNRCVRSCLLCLLVLKRAAATASNLNSAI